MNVSITGKNFEIDVALEKYVTKKVDKLLKYVPRVAKGSAHAEVTLSQQKGKSKDAFQAEIILTLPKEELVAKDATINMYAAVDIVEAKIKNQLRKYKEQHTNHSKNRRAVMEKVRKVTDREFWGRQN